MAATVSSQDVNTCHEKRFDKTRCKLGNEVTEQPHVACSAEVTRNVIIITIVSKAQSNSTTNDTRDTHSVATSTDERHGAGCLNRSVLDKPQQEVSEMHRHQNQCERNEPEPGSRFLEHHTKKDTLMMILDTGAEIHVVCDRHRKRLYDRTTVVKGAITLDTAGSSVPIEEIVDSSTSMESHHSVSWCCRSDGHAQRSVRK